MDDASPAEQALWRWAVDQLPDDVLVLPQVAMTVPAAGRPREAEADLVLIDPAHGITVIEVKGGVLDYDSRRAQWRRTSGRHPKSVRDPVEQAKRTRSILKAAIDASGIQHPHAIAMRWAVATPDCRLEAPGEPVLPGNQLWDALAGEQLDRLYRSTCGPLTTGEQPLGDDRARYLADYLRGRTRSGRGVLSTAVDDHEVRVRLHTESHRNVLKTIWRNPHVLVRGSAGTGKTVLALEAASAYASMGQRVLLCCWNVVLAAWLRESLRADLQVVGMDPALVTDDPTGKVVVSHVVGLARHGDAPAPPVDLDERTAYYHEVLPEALTPRVTQGEFDVVVLDEAQDLSELWVLAVASMVKRQGRWYAFSDRQQDLFHADAALPDFLELQHELTENFRNSAQIAAFAAQFGDIETDCLTGDGADVAFVACAGEEVVERAEAVARQRVREDGIAESDLALLYLFHNPFKDRTDDVAAMALAGERIATNGASFKGMERPVVVLGLDLDPTKTDRIEEVRRAIYTAATRARSHLTVVGDPDGAAAYGFDALAEALRGAVAE